MTKPQQEPMPNENHPHEINEAYKKGVVRFKEGIEQFHNLQYDEAIASFEDCITFCSPAKLRYINNIDYWAFRFSTHAKVNNFLSERTQEDKENISEERSYCAEQSLISEYNFIINAEEVSVNPSEVYAHSFDRRMVLQAHIYYAISSLKIAKFKDACTHLSYAYKMANSLPYEVDCAHDIKPITFDQAEEKNQIEDKIDGQVENKINPRMKTINVYDLFMSTEEDFSQSMALTLHAALYFESSQKIKNIDESKAIEETGIAIKLLKQAHTIDLNYAPAYAILTQIYFETNDTSEMLNNSSKAIQLCPGLDFLTIKKRKEFYYNYIFTYETLADPSNSYTNAAIDTYFQLGKINYNKESYVRSAYEFDQFINCSINQLEKNLRSRGRPQQNIKHITDQKRIELQCQIANFYYQEYHKRYEKYVNENQLGDEKVSLSSVQIPLENAINLFNEIARINPNNCEARSQIDMNILHSKQDEINDLKLLGHIYFNINPEQSILFYKRILILDPFNAVAHIGLAYHYYLLKNEDEHEHIESAISSDPDLSHLQEHEKIIALYDDIEKKLHEPLAASLNTALIDRNHIEALEKIGNIHFNENDLDKARDYYQAIVVLDPSNTYTHLKLVYLYNRLENDIATDYHLHAAISSDPTLLPITNINERKKLYFKAQHTNADACIQLAKLNLQENDYEKAIDYYLQAQAIDSSNSHSQAILFQILDYLAGEIHTRNTIVEELERQSATINFQLGNYFLKNAQITFSLQGNVDYIKANCKKAIQCFHNLLIKNQQEISLAMLSEKYSVTCNLLSNVSDETKGNHLKSSLRADIDFLLISAPDLAKTQYHTHPELRPLYHESCARLFNEKSDKRDKISDNFIHLDPNNPSQHITVANLYYDNHNHTLAKIHYINAINISPELNFIENEDERHEILIRAANPDEYNVNIHLANSHYNKQDFYNALIHYSIAIAIRPELKGALHSNIMACKNAIKQAQQQDNKSQNINLIIDGSTHSHPSSDTNVDTFIPPSKLNLETTYDIESYIISKPEYIKERYRKDPESRPLHHEACIEFFIKSTDFFRTIAERKKYKKLVDFILIGLEPKDYFIYIKLARLCRDRHMHPAAKKYYEKAIFLLTDLDMIENEDEQDEILNYVTHLDEYYIYIKLAKSYYIKQDFHNAFIYYSNAIALKPELKKNHISRALACQKAIEQRQYQENKSQYEQTIIDDLCHNFFLSDTPSDLLNLQKKYFLNYPELRPYFLSTLRQFIANKKYSLNIENLCELANVDMFINQKIKVDAFLSLANIYYQISKYYLKMGEYASKYESSDIIYSDTITNALQTLERIKDVTLTIKNITTPAEHDAWMNKNPLECIREAAHTEQENIDTQEYDTWTIKTLDTTLSYLALTLNILATIFKEEESPYNGLLISTLKFIIVRNQNIENFQEPDYEILKEAYHEAYLHLINEKLRENKRRDAGPFYKKYLSLEKNDRALYTEETALLSKNDELYLLLYLIDKERRNTRLLMQIADIYLQDKDYATAIYYLKQVIDLDESNYLAQLSLALSKHHHPYNSFESFETKEEEEEEEEDDDDEDEKNQPHNILKLLLLKTLPKEKSEVDPINRSLIRNFYIKHPELVPLYKDIYLELALMQKEEKHINEAIYCYESLIALTEEANDDIVQYHFQIAELHIQNNSPEDARPHYEAALAIAPLLPNTSLERRKQAFLATEDSKSMAYMNLGKLCLHDFYESYPKPIALMYFHQAIDAYELALKNGRQKAHLQLIEIYKSFDLHAKLKKQYISLITSDIRLNIISEIKDKLEIYMLLKDEEPETLFGLAELYKKENNLSTARDYYLEYIKKCNNEFPGRIALAHISVAMINIQKQNNESTLSHYISAINLCSDLKLIYFAELQKNPDEINAHIDHIYSELLQADPEQVKHSKSHLILGNAALDKAENRLMNQNEKIKYLEIAVDFYTQGILINGKEGSNISLYQQRALAYCELMKYAQSEIESIEYNNKALVDMMHLIQLDEYLASEFLTRHPDLSEIYSNAQDTLISLNNEYNYNYTCLYGTPPSAQHSLFNNNRYSYPTSDEEEEEEKDEVQNTNFTIGI